MPTFRRVLTSTLYIIRVFSTYMWMCVLECLHMYLKKHVFVWSRERCCTNERKFDKSISTGEPVVCSGFMGVLWNIRGDFVFFFAKRKTIAEALEISVRILSEIKHKGFC